MSKKFQKNIEDFTCGKCAYEVTGTGFTDHCPKCLWSRHVDKKPGDREETCGGFMKPVGVEGTQAKYILIYRCDGCGFQNKNKIAPDDNFEEVLKVARKKWPD